MSAGIPGTENGQQLVDQADSLSERRWDWLLLLLQKESAWDDSTRGRGSVTHVQ